ncbi:hypothetical protein MHYP_G00040500 [Metynnis hypsauchen]
MHNASQADPPVLEGITVGTRKAHHHPAQSRRALLRLKGAFGGVFGGLQEWGAMDKRETDRCRDGEKLADSMTVPLELLYCKLGHGSAAVEAAVTMLLPK